MTDSDVDLENQTPRGETSYCERCASTFDPQVESHAGHSVRGAMITREFLEARIGEEEAFANYASWSGWLPGDEEWGGWWLGHYQHYVRHDPARVLAECAAKREVLGLLDDAASAPEIHADAWVYLKRVVEVMARAYADHPDYPNENAATRAVGKPVLGCGLSQVAHVMAGLTCCEAGPVLPAANPDRHGHDCSLHTCWRDSHPAGCPTCEEVADAREHR